MNVYEHYFLWATILKPHGISGELYCKLHISVPVKVLKSLESVFVKINEQQVPFFIKSLSCSVNAAWIKFDDVNSIEKAKYFTGREIFLSKNSLSENELFEKTSPLLITKSRETCPSPIGRGMVQSGLKGYLVMDENGYEYGTVKEMIENTGQVLLEVTYNNKDILIPVHEAIIKSIDEQMKVIVVELPEGLAEL